MRHVAAVLGLMAGVSIGCAGTPTMAAERSKISPTIVPTFEQPDLSAANATYKLSNEELRYDCKRLTGRIQVRIRQLRSTQSDPKTSELARGMQKAVTPFVAGTTRAIDPDGDNARDRAMLRAYNAQLAAKNCKTFDLEAELKAGATSDPRPVAKPAAAPAAGKAP
jgi:hypothetical protein